MKDQLIFDTTETADSDNVGAYLRASDGTLLTHTDVAGKKALDVRIAEGINVEVDLSHVDDSVRLGDGTTLTTVTTVGGDNGLDVNIINTSVSIDDGGGSITIDATDLDIRDLDHAQDDIRLGDGTTLTTVTTVGSDNGLDVYTLNDPSTADTAIANAVETLDVVSTAQDIIASPLADRKVVYVYNSDNKQMFIGASGVTAANGFPISPGSYMELRAGASVDIEYVSSKLNHEIRTMEIS